MPKTEVEKHTLDISTLKWKDEVATLEELDLDPSYQRHVVDRLVQVIAANYNPILAGKLVVSRRNGSSYIVDGQQRWHGAREAGISKVGVIAVYGLDRETEARLFLALNEGRVAVRALDNFRAAYVSGSQYALDINECVEQRGGRIKGIHQPSRDSDIQAVEALRWIYKRGGIRGLNETLDIVASAFSELSQPTCPGHLVKGLFAIISLHRDDIDRDRLARKVDKAGLTQIGSLAHGMGQVLGATAGQRSYYLALLQIYNDRLGANAIEPAGTLNRISSAWKDADSPQEHPQDTP